MSSHFARTFLAKIFILIVLILLGPLSSIGALFDKDEWRRGRPLTPLQLLVHELEQEVSSADDYVHTEKLVHRFMEEQGFSISRDLTGPRVVPSTTNQIFLKRKITHEEVVNKALPPSISLYDYIRLIDSPQFFDVRKSALYAHLLREWEKKLSSEETAPYTPFLPGRSLTEGMLVFCPHPLDIKATRQFLSSLYTVLDRLQKIKGKVFVPQHSELSGIFRIFAEHRENKEEVLTQWGASVLEDIERFYDEESVLLGWDHAAHTLTSAREEIIRALKDTKPPLSITLITELSKIEAALAITQYLSDHRGIQFVNPFQARTDLLPLYIRYTQTPVSQFPLLTPIYTLLNELGSFTFSQIDQLSHSLTSLATRLPPLHLVPVEHQEALRKAYKWEKCTSAGVFGFGEHRKNEQQVLEQFEERILQESLTQINTPNKEKYLSLQQESRVRVLTSDEQEALKRLRSSIIEETIDHGVPSQWHNPKIVHLTLQERVALAGFSYDVFKLKHHKAVLNLEYVKRSFLLLILANNDPSGEKRTPFQEERKRLLITLKKTEEDIVRVQEHAHQVLDLYKQRIQQLRDSLRSKQPPAAPSNTASDIPVPEKILSTQRLQEKIAALQRAKSILSLEALEQLLLRTLEQGKRTIASRSVPTILQEEEHLSPTLLSTLRQEVERAFVEERTRITASIKQMLSTMEEMRSSMRLRGAFGMIESLVRAHKDEVEHASLDPDILSLLETISSFLHSALVSHLTHEISPETILESLRRSQQFERIEPTTPLYTSGQKAVRNLKIMTGAASRESISSTGGVENSSASSASSHTELLMQITSQLEETLQGLVNLPQKVIGRSLQLIERHFF